MRQPTRPERAPTGRVRARGKLIRMKDVNREAIHVYRRDAWNFLMQDIYAEAANVLERLTHLEPSAHPRCR